MYKKETHGKFNALKKIPLVSCRHVLCIYMLHTLLFSNPTYPLFQLTFLPINAPYWKPFVEVNVNISVPIPIVFILDESISSMYWTMYPFLSSTSTLSPMFKSTF